MSRSRGGWHDPFVLVKPVQTGVSMAYNGMDLNETGPPHAPRDGPRGGGTPAVAAVCPGAPDQGTPLLRSHPPTATFLSASHIT